MAGFYHTYPDVLFHCKVSNWNKNMNKCILERRMIRLLGEIIIYSKLRDFRLPNPIIFTIFINFREFYQCFCPILYNCSIFLLFYLKIYIHFIYQLDHSSFQNGLTLIFITISSFTMAQNVSVYIWSKSHSHDFGIFPFFVLKRNYQ